MEHAFAAVVPVYNKQPHIGRALASILNQTYGAREIIVVDDNSTDGSMDVVRSFTDPRIRVLSRDTPGAGGYAARNLAIHTATSKWIAFLDADDEWRPSHLEGLAQSIDAFGGAVVGAFSGFETQRPDGVREQDRRTRSRRHMRPQLWSFDDLLRLWIRQKSCPIWTGATCFRREALIDAGLFPELRCRRGGDKDLWLRVSALGDMAATPRATAIYHADSVNMVTRTTRLPGTHCIWPSIEGLMQKASPARRSLLKRVYNSEIWVYVYWNWRAGSLDEECRDHFFAEEEPVRALALQLLMSTTGPRLASLLGLAAAAKRKLDRAAGVDKPDARTRAA
jgi:glycosyltransferase involved in cell wall biosynthesis